jgi:hypothetical protein
VLVHARVGHEHLYLVPPLVTNDFAHRHGVTDRGVLVIALQAGAKRYVMGPPFLVNA